MISPPGNRFCGWVRGTLIVVVYGCFVALSGVHAFNLVLVGPGALEVKLISAKMAESVGDRCSIVSPPGEKFVQQCQRLMYGNGKDVKYPEGPKFVSTAADIGDALKAAQGIIITCEREGMGDSMVDTLLSNAPDVQHVCLLSCMGGRLRTAEESLQKKCASADVTLSIIRAGGLQGGGPGEVEGSQFGLSKYFDNTIIDLLEARTSMAFDKFTLGAKVSPGNPFPGPSRGLFGGASSSFAPSDTTTGRTAAAQALLTAIKMDTAIDISLSSEKGEMPPTAEEWNTLLSLSK